MMIIRANRIFNAAAVLPALAGICSTAFMCYIFWWPPKPAYVVFNPSAHSVSYIGGAILIHREYCINYQTPVTIRRELVKINEIDELGSADIRITLPHTEQMYALGCHGIDRIFEVPNGTPDGTYKAVFVASWSANPFRTASEALPELTVVINSEQHRR